MFMRKSILLLKVFAFLFGIMIYSTEARAQYFVNFEGTGEVKTAYASGTVNLSGINWDMTESLIGTATADWKNGARSTRMRGYGLSSMTMLENKANGIGTISFLYRRYGTDPQVDWKVEFSTDNGGTWTQIGPAFTAPASDVVQTFEEAVNVSGEIRVRIKRNTETGTSNNRLNIDDITITDYTGGTPVVATPTFTPPAGIYFNSQLVTIATTTENASVYYTTDGTDPDENSTPFTVPIPISLTTTLKARAYADGYNPSAITTGIYTLPVSIATISALKNSPLGGFYFLTGEVVLTFKQTFRNQKYIQDATAGLLIDDNSGVITTNYEIGDGITGIYGTLNVFGNMLQFTPFQDPGPATSAGNQIVPVVITLSEMTTNFAAYESRVVKINDASFTNPGGNFATGVVYPISDGSKANANFRTTFFDANYIGTQIPFGTGNIIGIPNARTEGNYITSRSLADLDFEQTGPISVTTIAQLRAGQVGQQYVLTGEAVLTYAQSLRNQKYVQDATAAIQIDDLPGNITTPYNIGDGITGLSGTLAVHNGMLRLMADADPGAPTSTNNVIVPQVVTIAGLFANFSSYQAELVKIENATFANGGSTFVEGTNYAISDASKANGFFRTEFFDANYIGTTIPSVPTGITGIATTVSNNNYITSRFLTDIVPTVIVPSITVISPNGYEFWERGTTQEIKWSSQNFTGNVKITLLRGFNVTLVNNIPNTGSWFWSISPTQTIADNYKIRIQGVNAGEPSDDSDNFFSIVDEIPVPKIVINEIMYNPASALGLDDFYEYLELYNNGNFDVDLTGWSIANAIGHTFASGPVLGQGEYLVVARHAETIMNHYGITNVVQWTSGNLNNTGEAIELKAPDNTLMDVVNYSASAPWPIAANGGGPSLELIDPDMDNSVPGSWMASLIINGTPGIENSIFGFESVTLVSPNGGEIFEQGASTDITWTRINFDGMLKIELFTQERETILLAENIPSQNNSWTWVIPADLAVSNSYKIRISDMEDGMPMDESDGTFSVVSVLVPLITVLTPNGGENWTQGTSHSITWESESFEGNVKIELFDGLVTTSVVEDISVALGTYLWAIPADQPVGNNYKIIISGMEPGSPSDESDAPFTIGEPIAMPLLVINEIMYNSTGSDNEWIEIYNNGAAVVDLEGYYILDDDDTHIPVVFPSGYSIAPGQYFTVSLEILAPPLHFIPDFVGNALWSLGNTSDKVRLFHPNGQLVNMVHYFDTAPWPTAPDGSGPSLSLLHPDLDNSLPENWAASLQDGGTPGAINFPEEPTITLLTPNGGEIIEQGSAYNITWNTFNYDGTLLIELMNAGQPGTAIEIGTVSAALGTFAWLVEQDPAIDYIISISDQLTGEPSDESDAVFSIILPPELPKVVITEIMYNSPEGGSDSLEYIELYNNDIIAHNLQGWYFTKGIDYTFPDVTIAPDGYLVVAINASAMFNSFGITALQWSSGALANGGEELELSNAFGEIIDHVNFDDVAPWPIAPDNYGPSLALLDPSLDNASGENWGAETNFLAINADGIPIYGTPGAQNFSTTAQGILLPAGWSGVSSYIVPDQPNVIDVMELMVDDLTIMQNFNQIYFPLYNVNSIGNWNNDVGYQLRTEAIRYLVIEGSIVTEKTVNLNSGWNGLPVLSECNVNLASLIDGITGIIFIREMGSNIVYWPDGGLFDLTQLVPGKAYFIKVSNPVTLTFPGCE